MNPPMQPTFWSFLSEWIYEYKKVDCDSCLNESTNVSYIQEGSFLFEWIYKFKSTLWIPALWIHACTVSSFIVNICVWILWRSGITDQIRQAPMSCHDCNIRGRDTASSWKKFCGFCLCLSDMRPSWPPCMQLALLC